MQMCIPSLENWFLAELFNFGGVYSVLNVTYYNKFIRANTYLQLGYNLIKSLWLARQFDSFA